MTAVARFDGTGYFNVSIPAGSSTTWTWRAQIQADSARSGLDSFYYLIGQAGNSSNQFVVEDLDSAPATKNCDSRAQSQNLNLSCSNADFSSSPTLIEIVNDGTGAELFIDGVSQNTDSSITTVNQVSEYIGRANANISDPFDLYYLEYEEDGVVEHRWEPPANASGTVMTDSVGSADATATGFSGSPFATITTTTIIDTVKGAATGVSVETSETGVAFTYSNDDPVSMQIGSDDGKTLDLTFTASSGSGTITLPSLATAAGFPYFTDATATPAKTNFLRATTANGTDDFDLTLTVEAPYVVVTMDSAALSASAGNPARIDANWSTKLVAGEQVLLDSSIATIDTGGILTIVTTDITFTSTAYMVNASGLEPFTVSDSNSVEPEPPVTDVAIKVYPAEGYSLHVRSGMSIKEFITNLDTRLRQIEGDSQVPEMPKIYTDEGYGVHFNTAMQWASLISEIEERLNALDSNGGATSIPLYRAEGYGVHVRSALVLAELLGTLDTRLTNLE